MLRKFFLSLIKALEISVSGWSMLNFSKLALIPRTNLPLQQFSMLALLRRSVVYIKDSVTFSCEVALLYAKNVCGANFCYGLTSLLMATTVKTYTRRGHYDFQDL